MTDKFVVTEVIFINDNRPWLMKYRGMAKWLDCRWLNRRSQSKNWSEFHAYLDRDELASPRKLTDLIAMSRAVC